jgi:signal peptidase I
MTKRKPAVANLRSQAPQSPAPSGGGAAEPSSSGGHHHFLSGAAVREAIESFAIALILAFLFRTFEAEAFVIPTGSMAPTLMGRHKDVLCPKCHYPYQVSASEEVNSDGSPREVLGADGVPRRTNDFLIDYGTCPMCRYTADLRNDRPYNGDRILVNKFAYELGEPERWDVIVFKYPGDPPGVPPSEHSDSRTNFIKRLVGLPGETIRIERGDVWVRKLGAARFEIGPRSDSKLLAMLQPVFDNDYMPEIADKGWPDRWHSELASPAGVAAAGVWRTKDKDKSTFLIDGTAKAEQWLRYHHLAPAEYYSDRRGGECRRPSVLQPQLITDFIAYNTGKMRMYVRHDHPEDQRSTSDGLGLHWVGDLALECTAESESSTGEFALELCKGGRRFQCRFDLSSGRATLAILGQPNLANWHPTALTSMKGPGRHKLRFSNCDDELRLWVDGSRVRFDPVKTSYPDLGNARPNDADLAPVGVASVGAAVQVGHLRILRDIYYVADCYVSNRDPMSRHDVCYQPGNAFPSAEDLLPESVTDYVDFPLELNQFFVLGDNSPKSRDARLWGPDHFVPRDLLIGKALFIYWPHSWDQIPYVDIPFPYFPNVSRMGLVR